MRVRMPTPLKGWREFSGEVGVIVLGVLIALTAQQIVEEIQDRADERALRETIDHEIGLNLYLYDLRSRQFACDKKHIDELVKWMRRTRSGKPVPALMSEPPKVITPYRSAWDNRDAQVFNQLPVVVRQKYAEFYDELTSNWSTMLDEQKHWIELSAYTEGGPISLADRRAIRPTIAKIRIASSRLEGNLPISWKIAEVLKVGQVAPDNFPADALDQAAECKPIIASWAETSKMNIVDQGLFPH